MRFQRAISHRVERLARHFKVVALTGARQAGKTTLLRELFPQYTHVTLDVPQDAALAEQAPEEFLARYRRPLLIDEVQCAPKLFRHLKAVVDASAQKAQFILTGSQRFSLMKEVSESWRVERQCFSSTRCRARSWGRRSTPFCRPTGWVK